MGRGSADRAGVVQAEAHLEPDLDVSDRPVGQVSADFGHLEPVESVQGLGGSFDAVVASFLFCVLPEQDQVPALRELARVCKPGGVIRLLEYTRPRSPFRRWLTRAWEPWVRWAYGASFDRHAARSVPAAGLELEQARFVVDELVQYVVARPRV